MIDFSLLCLSVIWGINNPLIKHALIHFLPLAFNGLCFLFASVIVLIAFASKNAYWPRFGKDWGKVIFVGVVGNTIYQLLFIFGINLTLAGNTSLILASVPAFVAFISYFMRKEREHWSLWVGIVVSFIGVLFVILGGDAKVGISHATLKGDLIVLLGAITTATSVVLNVPLAKRYEPLELAVAMLSSGGLLLFFVSIPSLLKQNWHIVTYEDWLSLMYSACLATAFASILVYRGIKQNGGTRMAMYNNVVPLVSLLVAALLLKEIPGVAQLIGGVAILFGTFLTGTES